MIFTLEIGYLFLAIKIFGLGFDIGEDDIYRERRGISIYLDRGYKDSIFPCLYGCIFGKSYMFGKPVAWEEEPLSITHIVDDSKAPITCHRDGHIYSLQPGKIVKNFRKNRTETHAVLFFDEASKDLLEVEYMHLFKRDNSPNDPREFIRLLLECKEMRDGIKTSIVS